MSKKLEVVLLHKLNIGHEQSGSQSLSFVESRAAFCIRTTLWFVVDLFKHALPTSIYLLLFVLGSV